MWNKCIDRLPEKNGTYLCAYKGLGGIYYTVQSFAIDLYEINMWEFADKKGASGFYGSDSEWGTYVTDPVAWAEIDEYKE